MRKIAVIGANEPLLRFYRQAKSLGYYIVGIAYEKGAVCKEYCDKFYPISFTEKEKVLAICQQEHIDGITSFSLESALPTVVFVARNMGLTSNDEECIKRTATKYSERVAFEEQGLPVPKYFRIKSVDEILNCEISYPVIVKPLDGGGSMGITKLDDTDGLEEAIQFAVLNSRMKEAIVEEYIEGREFSIESISHNGIHHILQITDKVTSGEPHYIEMQHHQPADISEETASMIRQTVERGLTALRIKNSAGHTELRISSDGTPFIIEVGARMGGDMITSDLVRLSTGYDMVKGVLELATGDWHEPSITKHKYSGVYFSSPLAPYIADFIKKSDHYSCIVDSNLTNRPIKEALSNADRNGFLIYQSDTGKIIINDRGLSVSNEVAG